MDEIKMIIAVRRDLHMTRGKEIAQACHACVGALLHDGGYEYDEQNNELNHIRSDGETAEWLTSGCAKVCVKVDSEEALFDLKKKADDAGINNCLIVDAGRTMFHGVETSTCIALGPARCSALDPITGKLQVY
jgi:peptidyl-tRNA hydrolase, PTH2 family